MSYLTKQGLGQFVLLNSAKPNQKILKSDSVSSENKEKIKLIEKYKEYFYNYFERPTTPIYSKTVILDQDAVTYLVIRSKHDEVKAIEECFMFAGCFPYLGFFKLKDAQDFKDEKGREGEITYLRPVYAYSSLGYFTDPILSSFFYFDELELAELIFHELFHTVFFIKDEIDLNESMANHFARELTLVYFKDDPIKTNILKGRMGLEDKINKVIVNAAHDLQNRYQKNCPCDPNQSKKIFDDFYKDSFSPKLKILCGEIKKVSLKNVCRLEERQWNNAAFAASLTYEENAVAIDQYFIEKKGDLKLFLKTLENTFIEYKKLKTDLTFTDYLLKK